MIKFFRQIRLDLIGKNKTGKYLKYAIGEIVLVVVGILIALSINNWNIRNKEEQKELVYIKSMIEDIESDIIQSENIIERLDLTVARIDSLLLELSSQHIYHNSNNAYRLFISSAGFADFTPNDRTIQILKNSGGFELISHKEASDAIWEYDKHVKIFQSQDNMMGNALSNMILFEFPFDLISLNNPLKKLSPIPLLSKDQKALNDMYFNRLYWSVGANSLKTRIQKVHDTGIESVRILKSTYDL